MLPVASHQLVAIIPRAQIRNGSPIFALRPMHGWQLVRFRCELCKSIYRSTTTKAVWTVPVYYGQPTDLPYLAFSPTFVQYTHTEFMISPRISRIFFVLARFLCFVISHLSLLCCGKWHVLGFLLAFLDATTHLNKRSRPSVRPSVRRSVPCYFRR